MIEGRFNPSDWHVSIQGEGISWEEVRGRALGHEGKRVGVAYGTQCTLR